MTEQEVAALDCDGYVSMCADEDGTAVLRMDGTFSAEQLHAFARWAEAVNAAANV